MEFCKMKQDLISLKKQSDLLCAYLFSRESELKYGEGVEELRRVAMSENAKTSERGNEVGGRKGWDTRFTVWGSSTYGPRYPPAELVEGPAEGSKSSMAGRTTPPT